MAQREVKVKMCDRDGFGKQRPAEVTRSFSFDGGQSWYEIDLCAQHDAMFDREISAWRLLAREVEAPPNSPKRSTFFTEEQRRETQRIRELAEKARAKNAVENFAARRAAEIDKEQQLEQLERDELNARQVIPGALKWRLVDHARERMVERGFTIAEVLRAAAQPATVFDNLSPNAKPGTMLHKRGACIVVVNPSAFAILTVLDRDYDPAIGSTPTIERQAQ